MAVTLCYYIPSLNALYVVRVICGFTVGNFNCICPIATKEILPSSLVSFGGIMFYAFVSFGILVTSVFGAFINTDFLLDHYRYILCLPVIISVFRLSMILIFFRLETPQFIIEKYCKLTRMSETVLRKTLNSTEERSPGFFSVPNDVRDQ